MRERMPVSSHVLVNDPQALHAPNVRAEHISPSVERVQLPVSVLVSDVHVPLEQVQLVTPRERIPVVSHVSAKSEQAVHAP